MKSEDPLADLVYLRGDLREVAERVCTIEASLHSLTVLGPTHISSVLRRFIAGSISAKDVERWADLVEGRDGLEYDDGQEEKIANALFILSNPDINNVITKFHAAKLLRDFEAAL